MNDTGNVVLGVQQLRCSVSLTMVTVKRFVCGFGIPFLQVANSQHQRSEAKANPESSFTSTTLPSDQNTAAQWQEPSGWRAAPNASSKQLPNATIGPLRHERIEGTVETAFLASLFVALWVSRSKLVWFFILMHSVSAFKLPDWMV